MPSQHLSLSLLFRILPRTAELAALRQAILSSSITDPQDEWKGSDAHGTLDRRVISESALEEIFADAEARSVAHVHTYHRLLQDALRQASADGGDAALRRLGELGEAAAEAGYWESCISYYGAVAAIAREVSAFDLLMVAERRMGRAHLHLGHPRRAARWYVLALQTARDVGDGADVVNAHMGLGHALSAEGRWQEAEEHYLEGHETAGSAHPHLHAQTAINLSMTAREQSRPGDAARWLEVARALWHDFDAAERSVWHNNDGLLALAQGRLDEARSAFDNALTDAPSHHDRAMILDNLAEICLRSGDPDGAEMHAREAEDYAIAGASARALADIYIRLGRIMRDRRDLHGVAFFEKAIQLSRENGYTLTEATACTEYSLFRLMLGDEDESQGLRERAEHLLAHLASRSPIADA